MPIRFSELHNAFEYANAGGLGECRAVLDRRTGTFYYHSENDGDPDEDEPFPDEDELDDPRFVEIPDRHDLDLGKRLVLDFAATHLPDEFDHVREIFSRRGAYARFKDLLARRGRMDQWYEFSNAAEEAALRAWCELEEIELEG